jgi:hypothetical protein
MLVAMLLALAAGAAAAQDRPAAAAGRADDIQDWCQTMGAGARGMAGDRDRGMSKEQVIAKVVNGRDLSPRLRGSIDMMADTAYRYRSFPPGSVKMMAYGICVTQALGILDVDMLKQIEGVVGACKASKADPADFDHCADTGIAGLIDARAARRAP